MICKEEYEITDDIRALLTQLSVVYERTFKQTFDFHGHFMSKFKNVEKACCLVMYDNNLPVGFAFFEKISAFYGAITLYVTVKKYCRALSKAVFKQERHLFRIELFLFEKICY